MAGRQVKIDPGELDALLASSSAVLPVKKEEHAIAEYTLVATPSKRQFHVMNFAQNDFKIEAAAQPVYLTRAQGYIRKKRSDLLDPSIAPYSGAHRVNRAFQPKTKAVFADKRTPEQIAEAERERYPWIMRESDGRTYEGRVGLDSVARYVMFVKSGNEICVVPIKKWYNFQAQSQTQPMTMEEIDQLQKQHLKIIGESASKAKGRAGGADDDDGDLTERRRRANEEETDVAVDEGEWDYAEQDDEVLEDIGENTAANLKSGREKTFEELEAERNEELIDKELKDLLKEMRDDYDEPSSDSESFSFSDESDESDSDESSEGEEAPVAKAPPAAAAPKTPAGKPAASRSGDVSPRVVSTPAEQRKRAAEEPASATVKKVKQEPGTPPRSGSPAPDPLLLLSKDEVRRMWREPVTVRDFYRIVRPRLKQHPGNQALLSQFMKEIFVIRNDKLHLINP